MPWLTVVMPVHNGAQFLDATLASATAERPEGVEFLLYDSSDDAGASQATALRYAHDLAIRYTATPECKRWTAKTNRGVREAAATHVVMLHQDDLWRPGHLAALRTLLAQVPDVPLSIGPSHVVSGDGREMGPWRLPFAPGMLPGADFAETMIVQNTVAIPSAVIRRDAWMTVGGLDDNLWYTADWDLYLKLARLGDVHVRDAATTAFRLHGGSLTMTGSLDPSDFRGQMTQVLARHIASLKTERRGPQERLGRAAIEVNCALAAVSRGNWRELLRAASAMLALGLHRLPAFLHQTRLIERTIPRLRLSLARGM